MNNTLSTIFGLLILIIIVVGGAYWYVRTPTQNAPSPSPTTTPSGGITFPTGGETFTPGDTYTLAWSDPVATGTSTQIFLINTALELQGESVSISDRVYDVPGTGSYEYTVPASTPSGTYKFAIGTLTSDMFQIASSSPTP